MSQHEFVAHTSSAFQSADGVELTSPSSSVLSATKPPAETALDGEGKTPVGTSALNPWSAMDGVVPEPDPDFQSQMWFILKKHLERHGVTDDETARACWEACYELMRLCGKIT
jgi:hypothetical protein